MSFLTRVENRGEHEISSGSGRLPENFEILEFIGILERFGKKLGLGRNWEHDLEPSFEQFFLLYLMV